MRLLLLFSLHLLLPCLDSKLYKKLPFGHISFEQKNGSSKFSYSSHKTLGEREDRQWPPKLENVHIFPLLDLHI